jgi:putative hydrolase of the HAD superfamily
VTSAPRPALAAVLFDAAGTLLELRAPVGEIYAEAAARHGLEIGAWRLGDAFARVLRQMPPMLFAGADAREVPQLERAWWHELVRRTFRAADTSQTSATLDALFAELFECFATPVAWAPRAGALDALRGLRARGIRTAVVSNFDHRLDALLEALGLRRELDLVLRAADCGARKPDAAIFRAALAALGVRAEQAVFVGDDPERDLAGARAAGLRAVDVRELATLDALPAALGLAPDSHGETQRSAS